MLRALTASRNIDVIVLTETWLSSQIEDSELTMSGHSRLRRDRRIGVHGGVAAFIKPTFSHENVADSISCHDKLEVLAFKIHGAKDVQLDIIVVYRPPIQSVNLEGIPIERIQEFSRASNMILVGDLCARNVNWKDITTSSHESSFDARLIYLCLDNFLVQYSILVTLLSRLPPAVS